MQSAQKQCCCCACSVFSALIGIVLVSTGVCLMLNYGLIDIDTSGLPPQFQNEEGKKIVGIILICVGLAAMGISAIVSILYYTIGFRPKPQISSLDVTSTSESSSSSSSSRPRQVRPKHKVVHDLKQAARHSSSVPSVQRVKRHKRKPPQYHNRLATHREESDVNTLNVKSGEGEIAVKNENQNNNCSDQLTTNSAFHDASASIKPTVICVDSSVSVGGVTNDAFIDDSLSPVQMTRPEPSDIKTLDDDINNLMV